MNVNTRLSQASKVVWVVVVVGVVIAGSMAGGAWLNRKKNTSKALANAKDASHISSDFGVNVSNKINDLVYVKEDNAAYLSSKSLIESSGGSCSADQAPLGKYLKIMKSEVKTDDDLNPWWFTQDGLSKAMQPDENGDVRAKEFNDYYLVYITPQSPCGNDQLTKKQLDQAQLAARAVVSAQVQK